MGRVLVGWLVVSRWSFAEVVEDRQIPHLHEPEDLEYKGISCSGRQHVLLDLTFHKCTKDRHLFL